MNQAAAPTARRAILSDRIASQLIRPLRDLASLRIASRGNVTVVAAIAVLVVAFEGLGVAMLLPILDYVQAKGDVAKLSADSVVWRQILAVYAWVGIPVNLFSLCATVFVLTVLRQVTFYIHFVRLTVLRHDIGRRMSMRLFRGTFSSDAAYIQRFGTGSFVYLLTTQVQAANALINSYSSLWSLFLTFAAYGAIILWVAPLTSLLAFALLAVAVLSISHFVRASRDISRQMVRAGERWSRFITERHRAWRLVKLSDAMEHEAREAKSLTDRVYKISVHLARVAGRIELVMAPIVIFAVLAGLYVSVAYLSVSVPLITLFVIIIMRLMPVARNLAGLRQSIAVQSANLDRVMTAFRETEAARELDDGTQAFQGLSKRISFDDVSFQYPGGNIPALRSVTLDIPARRVTAIMGPSGAGKSTLVDLVPRLIRPTAGAIAIDGTPLSDFTLSSLRRRIAYVSQEPIVFDATVSDNLRYLRREATQAEIEQACRAAFADEFIEAMPEGYDTRLGEGGARMSGGQRQRLVLARAYLARPSILILDEPTSALDYDSERKVQRALEALVKEFDITLIVIAHRLSTVRNADHVIVLRDGRVIEAGAPAELNRTDSWFAAVMSADHASVDNADERERRGRAEDPADISV